MLLGGILVNFKEISVGEKIADSLSKRESKGYVVTVEANRKLTIDLRGPASQDFDLYIKYNEEASTAKWDYKQVTTKADESITIDPISPGAYYILVYAYSLISSLFRHIKLRFAMLNRNRFI